MDSGRGRQYTTHYYTTMTTEKHLGIHDRAEKHHLLRLLNRIEHEWSWKPMQPLALQKVKRYLHGIEKPQRQTLDKLSLFVGFQNWESFKATLNGETDGQVNFERPKQNNDNEE